MATCGLLLVAGFEITVNLVGNAVAALAGDPAWSRLAAEPGVADVAAEEALRFDPPVQLTLRFAREYAELDGRRLPKGTFVAVLLAAANRDPAAYADPNRFRLDRQGEPEHLTFSSGIHYCLGAPAGPARGRLRPAGDRGAVARPDPAARSAAAYGDDDPGVRSLPVQVGRRRPGGRGLAAAADPFEVVQERARPAVDVVLEHLPTHHPHPPRLGRGVNPPSPRSVCPSSR